MLHSPYALPQRYLPNPESYTIGAFRAYHADITLPFIIMFSKRILFIFLISWEEQRSLSDGTPYFPMWNKEFQ